MCEVNQLASVNSFSRHRARGTWWHRALQKWYELDGFILHQRHSHVVAMQVINEVSFSDHKPMMSKINTQMKKWRTSVKLQPNIKWEALRSGDERAEFRRRTPEMIENEEIGKSLEDIVCSKPSRNGSCACFFIICLNLIHYGDCYELSQQALCI